MFEKVCSKVAWCPRQILDATLELAVGIAREGGEGRRIGTLFTPGQADAVLEHSRALILDPIALHPRSARHISDRNLLGTLKELAQLDGTFVLDNEGYIVAACRYLEARSKDVEIPFGWGSRHLAAASTSKFTGAIAIVVSESALVRVFHNGCMEAEILPELWLISRHSSHLRGSVHQDNIQDLAVFTPEEPPIQPGSAA